MPTRSPDIFTNVHKGIRHALFDACVSLGRGVSAESRAVLGKALRFVRHHGENEDVLLLPLLQGKAVTVFQRMEEEHRRIGQALVALEAAAESSHGDGLYAQACSFTALYLEHMRVEEEELDAAIRAACTVEELAGFGRESVGRTAPADQKLMLSWMLPAMTQEDVEAFLGRLPQALAAELRPLAKRPAQEP